MRLFALCAGVAAACLISAAAQADCLKANTPGQAAEGRLTSVRIAIPDYKLKQQATILRLASDACIDGSDAYDKVEATLPAVISVVEKINEPRYPSFKGIMAAKKKPVETLSLADAGIDPGQVGLGAAATEVVSFAKRPPRQAGTVVKDDGDGGVKAAEFLASQKFI